MECSVNDLKIYPLILMGIATSIDSLIVGFTFSLLPKGQVFLYCLIIGIVTFLISGLGFILGEKLGDVLGRKANLLGGVLLILLSINVLI